LEKVASEAKLEKVAKKPEPTPEPTNSKRKKL